MIKVNDISQGSPEWFKAKAGVPSASSFDKILTTKGDPSKQAQKYMYQLAGEAITGVKEEGFQSADMTRGIEMEDEARRLYEVARSVDVETVGMCYPDEGKSILCSPDGLVGEEGGIEIKCPKMATHVEYLLSGKMPTIYIQQVQGSMYVTGRMWWDFISYYPGMKPLIVRIVRDNLFMKMLEIELGKFCVGLAETIKKIS